MWIQQTYRDDPYPGDSTWDGIGVRVAMGLFKALLPIMIEDLLWAVEISRE